jgi:hypothetical protein
VSTEPTPRPVVEDAPKIKMRSTQLACHSFAGIPNENLRQRIAEYMTEYDYSLPWFRRIVEHAERIGSESLSLRRGDVGECKPGPYPQSAGNVVSETEGQS